MQPSDEIKSKLDLVEVIRDYIQLKPAGVNFRANCPFHKEKTPSFLVSPEKQIWHCFGCSKGGDMFTFVQEIEGIDFLEALRLLARKAGVTLKKSDPKLTSQRNRLLDILEFSRRYYHKLLKESPSAANARAYLEKRGLDAETIEEWQIGYSLDEWENLIKLLKQRGFNENEIFLSGMSVKSDKRAGFYDRFRGRIMFPIEDINGNTVAFSARVSPEKEATEKLGKYINSPQTLIYEKSKILYGLDKAKREIKNRDAAVIVEGQMDSVTAHRNGFKNVAASSGTALTNDQVSLIKRYTDNLIFAFDTDTAGKNAVRRAAHEALQAGMNVKVLRLPKGTDPDEFVRENPSAWQGLYDNAEPIMEYFFKEIIGERDPNKIDDRRKIAAELLPIINQLGNNIDRDIWLKELSQAINVSENVLKETIANSAKPAGRENNAPQDETVPSGGMQTREEKMSELFMAMLLRFTTLIEYASDNVSTDQVVGGHNRFLYKNLLLFYNYILEEWTSAGASGNPPKLIFDDFRSWIASAEEKDEHLLPYLNMLVLLGDKDYYEYSEDQARSELINLSIFLKKHYLLARMKEIEQLIADSEKEKNADKTEDLMNEFRSLAEEFSEVGT